MPGRAKLMPMIQTYCSINLPEFYAPKKAKTKQGRESKKSNWQECPKSVFDAGIHALFFDDELVKAWSLLLELINVNLMLDEFIHLLTFMSFGHV